MRTVEPDRIGRPRRGRRAAGEHREQLERLTHALLEAETLDALDAYAAAGVPMRTAELEAAPVA